MISDGDPKSSENGSPNEFVKRKTERLKHSWLLVSQVFHSSAYLRSELVSHPAPPPNFSIGDHEQLLQRSSGRRRPKSGPSDTRVALTPTGSAHGVDVDEQGNGTITDNAFIS